MVRITRAFIDAVNESTCKKRTVVCQIYDKNGRLLAMESNRCNPKDGICTRIGLYHNKDGYPKESSCNWTHAEIMAIRAYERDHDKGAYRAVLYGHRFYCDACEYQLKEIGVQIFEIKFKPDD